MLKELLIIVKDTIFAKGYKGKDSVGSGLGMYLVKRIVEESGGDIDVFDSEYGGARFEVHLLKA